MTLRSALVVRLADAATPVAGSDPSDAVVGVGLAVVTVGLVFAVLLAVGFAILVRRGRRSRRSAAPDDSAIRAGIALVRLDDQITAAADELGFAIAQFGQDRVAPLESVLASARSNLTAAFRLRQQLDDAVGDTATARREWSARILMLCETASERLEREVTVLGGIRALERTAAHDLSRVRRDLAASRDRSSSADATLASLALDYTAGALAPIAEHPAEVARLLDSAARAAENAADRVDDDGAGDASSLVLSAERDVRRAAGLLDDLDTHRAALSEASARLSEATDAARAMIADARVRRDSSPDAPTGAAIADAISYVERALAAVDPSGEPRDPDAAIARLSTATDALDTAIAGARSEQQRLDHARAALSGALLTARSQLESTRTHIHARPGGVGAEARTRLAEAERLLEIASAESDPVIALDTARSSATYSRDADALARYDLLH